MCKESEEDSKMTAKKIGGYCMIRSALVKLLQEIPNGENRNLSRKDRECMYECDGWQYQKECYRGEDINLRGEQNGSAE
jgi:hypothetical protein